jgi:hypothetical protein
MLRSASGLRRGNRATGRSGRGCTAHDDAQRPRSGRRHPARKTMLLYDQKPLRSPARTSTEIGEVGQSLPSRVELVSIGIEAELHGARRVFPQGRVYRKLLK